MRSRSQEDREGSPARGASPPPPTLPTALGSSPQACRRHVPLSVLCLVPKSPACSCCPGVKGGQGPQWEMSLGRGVEADGTGVRSTTQAELSDGTRPRVSIHDPLNCQLWGHGPVPTDMGLCPLTQAASSCRQQDPGDSQREGLVFEHEDIMTEPQNKKTKRTKIKLLRRC